MDSLPDHGQSTRLWTVYQTMDSLPDYGQSTGPWTVYQTMDSLPDYGQSTGLWTVYQTMDSLPDHGQSTRLWTVYQTMDSLPDHGQSTGPWTVFWTMDSLPDYGQSTRLWTVYLTMAVPSTLNINQHDRLYTSRECHRVTDASIDRQGRHQETTTTAQTQHSCTLQLVPVPPCQTLFQHCRVWWVELHTKFKFPFPT